MKGTINIGGAERSLGDANANWIQEQFGSRKSMGVDVCVRVSIHAAGVNVALATPACSGGGGGGRPPNRNEERILDLWRQHRLDSNDFNVGQLVAFVKQLLRL